jgi:hypothetical protein
MSLRGLCVTVVAIPSLIGIAAMSPAFGRGGAAGFSSRPSVHVRSPMRIGSIVPRTIVRAGRVQAYGRAYNLGRGRDSLAALWPYWWFLGSTPFDASPVESGVAPDPYIIVISGQPHDPSGTTTSAKLPDYGYVSGCYAIPNGYHCDIHHGGTAP